MMSTSIPSTSPGTARLLTVVASLAAGVIYVLIGVGMVSVGESTEQATTDLVGLGAVMAFVSVAVAALVWLLPASRVVLAGVFLVEAMTLLGYVAFAGLREPPFELWGLLIKAFQAIVLVGATYLFINARHPRAMAGGLAKDGVS
jgi:hypothetical protein